jgi:hypothetical protein
VKADEKLQHLEKIQWLQRSVKTISHNLQRQTTGHWKLPVSGMAITVRSVATRNAP